MQHSAIATIKSQIQPDQKVLEIDSTKESQQAILSYQNNSFDLVISTFQLQKSPQPEQVVLEMIRVLKKEGRLYITAPNYGAPIRRSPNFNGNRLLRAYHRINADVWHYVGLKKHHTLSWLKLPPTPAEKKSQANQDVICEPYIITLLSFLQLHGLVVKSRSTCWDIPEPNEKFTNKIFRFLGKQDLYPFKYWGPHIYIEAEKKALKEVRLKNTINLIVHWLKITTLIIIIFLPFTPLLLALWVIIQKLLYSLLRQLKNIKKEII